MSITHEGFTPGPWSIELVNAAGSLVYARIGPARRGSIAYTGVYGSRKVNAKLSEDEVLANARLIADAPRLYAENQRLRDALERLADAEDTYRLGDESGAREIDGALRQARAALTGDTP